MATDVLPHGSPANDETRNGPPKRSTAVIRDFIAVARGADLVVVRVVGKGNMLNAPALADFAEQQRRAGYRRFVFDLARCTGLDSTFMGVMVGIFNSGNSESARLQAARQEALLPPPKPVVPDAGEGDAKPMSADEAAAMLRDILSRPPEAPGRPQDQQAMPPTGTPVETLVSAVNVSNDVRALMAMLGVDAFVRIRGECDLSQLESALLPERAVNSTERRKLILKAHETLVEMDRRNEAQFGGFLRSLSAELSREK